MRSDHHHHHRTSLGKRLPSATFALALAAIAAGAVHAQPASPPQSTAQPLTLSAEQRAGIESAVRANPQVQATFRGSQAGAVAARVLVGAPEVDKAEAQAFLTGDRVQPPAMRVTALVLNPAGTVARRVVVLPAENNRVVSVEQVPPAAVPFSEDDLAAAWALTQREPTVQRALGGESGRFRTLSAAAGAAAPEPYAVEALPLRSTDPKDPCSRDRCLDLIFRTPDGYLSTRAHVNLTRQTVAAQGTERQR
jgi:hypothetical protein